MLSARAYSFRMKSRLAISLSWIGGYVNTIAWLQCGVAVSHMSGNATHFGQAIARLVRSKNRLDAVGSMLFFGFLLGVFLIGAALSGLLTESARRRGARSKFIVPMAVEAALLTIFTLGINLNQGQMSQFTLYILSGTAA